MTGIDPNWVMVVLSIISIIIMLAAWLKPRR